MGARKLKKSEQLGSTARFELLVRLAAGGMGAVYLAVPRGQTGPLVAIKRAHPHLLEESGFVKMFIAEARLASAIDHPTAIGVREVESSEDELMLVMRYVEGGSLGDMLATAFDVGKRVPPSVALRVVVDAARGLHAAHVLQGRDGRPLGIVHRDISPQNILVGVDGVAAIVDFGVAKAALGDSTQTSTGILKGKMAYMAPEYVSRRTATPQTDVFALGVVCWEAIANRRLFRGEDDVESMQRILSPTPAPLLSEVCGFDLGVSAVIARALTKDPSKRFVSAKDFADALEAKAQLAELLASPAEVALSVRGLLGPELVERRRLVDDALGPARRAGATQREAAALQQTMLASELAPDPGVHTLDEHPTVAVGAPDSVTPQRLAPVAASAASGIAHAPAHASALRQPPSVAIAPHAESMVAHSSVTEVAPTIAADDPTRAGRLRATTPLVIPSALARREAERATDPATGPPPLAPWAIPPVVPPPAVRAPAHPEVARAPLHASASYGAEPSAVPGLTRPLSGPTRAELSRSGPSQLQVLVALSSVLLAAGGVAAYVGLAGARGSEPPTDTSGVGAAPSGLEAPTAPDRVEEPATTGSANEADTTDEAEDGAASPPPTPPSEPAALPPSSGAAVAPSPDRAASARPLPSSVVGGSRLPSPGPATTKPAPTTSQSAGWRPKANPY